MVAPGSRDYPWRVRVHGSAHGAGVLLSQRHVLTCAHVMGSPAGTADVDMAGLFEGWESPARVVSDAAWAPRVKGRGDIALLELGRPAPPGTATQLWRAPLSSGRVRVSGYPEPETSGIPVDAELGGDGHGGEHALLKPVSVDGPWIEEGFSGAGVVALDGEHAGHVIGIVVSDYRNSNVGARAAWMIPAETISYYLRAVKLPGIQPWVKGERADQLSSSGGGIPPLSDRDTLRVALTKELAGLLTSDWAGTVVIPGGDTAPSGTTWLVRLVRTADPAARARTSDADLARAPQGTSLPLGAIDAAYDARDRSAADVAGYLSRRFWPEPGQPDRTALADRLLRRRPPVSLVIANIDQQKPRHRELIRDLVRPLAAGARLNGGRVVLGFTGSPPSPERLPHEVLLHPGPPSAVAGRNATAAEAAGRVTELAVMEKTAGERHRVNERRFVTLPTLPPARSQGLRAWLAAVEAGASGADAAAIAAEAEAALAALGSFHRRSLRLQQELERLRGRLAANRVRADRYFAAEDIRLDALYSQALAAVFDEPFELVAARGLVQEYVDEIDRRLDGGQPDE